MIFKVFSAISYFISRNFLKIVLKIFFRLKAEGAENVPKRGAFIIAGNHVSYMDPPILASATSRRLYFITTGRLYKNRLMGLWCRSVDCLRGNRGEANHTTVRKILNYLKNGKPVAIFPEGGRSDDGTIKDPLSGIGFLALKSRVPVVPCIIKGSADALPKGARFFKFSGVSARVGKPIRTDDFRYDGNKKEAYRLFSKKVM